MSIDNQAGDILLLSIIWVVRKVLVHYKSTAGIVIFRNYVVIKVGLILSSGLRVTPSRRIGIVAIMPVCL